LDQGWRCGAPTQQQQWGAQFNATEIVAIEAKIRADHGKEMAGVELGTPLLLLSWGSASPSLIQVGPGDVRVAFVEEGAMFMVFR
jgi:hypothetical protein